MSVRPVSPPEDLRRAYPDLLFYEVTLFGGDSNHSSPQSTPQDEGPTMVLPDLQMYKDIDKDMVLPPVNKTTIRHYLDCSLNKFRKLEDLYETRILLSVKVAQLTDQPSIFVKAQCRRPKNLQYETNIKINSIGEPEESHCECPKGCGTKAVCKHVAVALLGVESMIKYKHILTEVVFEKRNTDKPRKKKRNQEDEDIMNFNPLPNPPTREDIMSYNQRFLNLIANFPGSFPFKELLKPANRDGIENDHQYHKKFKKTDTNMADDESD